MPKKTIHNKLVRDGIPAEIEARGATCTYTNLSGLNLLHALLDKLVEESREVRCALTRAERVGELADVKAVLDHICAIEQIGDLELNDAVCEKQRKKGRFADGVFLLTSTEPEESE